MTQATDVKKQILASKIAYKRSLNNEERLERELAKFFNNLKKEVLNALDEYWNDYQLLQGQVNLICSPVHEAHKDYYELLTLYIKKEYRLGSKEATRLVKNATRKHKVAHKSISLPIQAFIKKNNDLFGTLPSAEERLLNKVFTASERTLSRVDSQINQIITDGYRSGKGINDVANSLTQKFDQLTDWESKRIARTEIHNAHNVAVMDTYEELDVEYTMWICAGDDRVRDSHIDIDGEIIPVGSEYSNGLKYPGDTDGPIEEWINCRCANAPYVIPYGYMAPSFSPFREEDLIKVETKDPQQIIDELQQQEGLQTIEPTQEQLKANLTKEELEQVEWAKNVQNSKYVSDTGKAKAKQILDELYAKASTGKQPTPKVITQEPTPVKKAPKLKPEPTTDVNRMSSNDLYNSMTKADRAKYDKARQSIENMKKSIGVKDPLFKPMTDKYYKTIKELESKQKQKLLNKQSKKPKQTKKLTKTQQKELKSFKEETPLNDFEKATKWADKRSKGKIEWAYKFDTKTGKIVGKEIRGGKAGAKIPDDGPNRGSLHIHTDDLSPWPSNGDIKTYRSMAESEHYIMSSNEVWYVHADENFGLLGSAMQPEIDTLYSRCIKEGNKAVESLMREGKISLDEQSIKKAADKEIGDRLLKEFSKPEWKNRGLEVRRAYR